MLSLLVHLLTTAGDSATFGLSSSERCTFTFDLSISEASGVLSPASATSSLAPLSFANYPPPPSFSTTASFGFLGAALRFEFVSAPSQHPGAPQTSSPLSLSQLLRLSLFSGEASTCKSSSRPSALGGLTDKVKESSAPNSTGPKVPAKGPGDTR